MIRKFETTIELLRVEPKQEPKAEPGEHKILAEIVIDDWEFLERHSFWVSASSLAFLHSLNMPNNWALLSVSPSESLVILIDARVILVTIRNFQMIDVWENTDSETYFSVAQKIFRKHWLVTLLSGSMTGGRTWLWKHHTIYLLLVLTVRTRLSTWTLSVHCTFRLSWPKIA